MASPDKEKRGNYRNPLQINTEELRAQDSQKEIPISVSFFNKPASPDVILAKEAEPSAADDQSIGDIQDQHPPGTTQQFGRYRVVRTLGQGGMGKVYLVYDPQLKRQVALKTIVRNDATLAKRFHREAAVMARLSHPNILPVYDVGEVDGVHFFTMEYIDGTTLEKIISQQNMSLRRVVEITRKIVLAIVYAHKQGIIHRDIKPSNILMDSRQEPKVMDFGLAYESASDVRLSKTGMALGTPAYMPPEQARGARKEIDEQSDVYSLGALFYELMTGRPPFAGNNANAVLLQVTSKEPVAPDRLSPKISKPLSAICLKALSKEKRYRYASAQEMAADMERWLNGEPVIATNPTPFTRGWRYIQRNRARCLPVAVVSLAMLAFLLHAYVFAPGSLYLIVRGDDKDIENAEVRVDGKSYKAKQKIAVSRGEHNLKIVAPGYLLHTSDIDVSAGKAFNLEIVLQPEQGNINIRSDLLIQANFRHKQTGKVHSLSVPERKSLPTGRYEVEFRRENYFPQYQEIEIIKDHTQDCSVTLEPMLVWKIDIALHAGINSMEIADLDRDGKLELICIFRNGSVVAYDLATREKLWEVVHNFDMRMARARVCDINNDGYLDILVGSHSRFFVLDGKSHQEIYHIPNWWADNYTVYDVTRDGVGEIIYFSAYEGLQCYDLVHARRLWPSLFKEKMHNVAAPLICDGQVIYYNPGEIYGLDLFSGRRMWQASVPIHEPINVLLGIELERKPHILVHSSAEGLILLSLQSKQVVWQKSEWKKACNGLLFFPEKNQIILHFPTEVYTLDAATGQSVGKPTSIDEHLALTKTLPVVPLAENKLGVVLETDHYIHIWDPAARQFVYRFCNDNSVIRYSLVHKAENGEHQILVNGDNLVYAVRTKPHAPAFQIWSDTIARCATLCENEAGKEVVVAGLHRIPKITCVMPGSTIPQWQSTLEKDSTARAVSWFTDKSTGKRRLLAIVENGFACFAVDGKQLWKTDLGNTYLAITPPQTPVFTETGGRQIFFIITYDPGLLYCIDTQGHVLWQKNLRKTFTAPAVVDWNNDGHPEVLVTSSNELLFFDIATGHNSCPPISTSETIYSRKIAVCDSDNDGYWETVLGHANGVVTYISAQSHSIVWRRRLYGDIMESEPFWLETDDRKRRDLFVSTYDYRVYCLDTATGSTLWQHYAPFSFPAQSFRCNLFALRSKSSSEVLLGLLVPPHSFVFLNRDGTWAGEIDDFGVLQTPPYISEQGNAVLGNNKDQIVYIPDMYQYVQSALNPSYEDWPSSRMLAQAAYLNRQGAYRHLSRLLDAFAGRRHEYGHIVLLYRLVCAIAQKNEPQAKECLQRLQSVAPEMSDLDFFTAILNLREAKTEQARTCIERILAHSIEEMERCERDYEKMLTPDFKLQLRALVAQNSRHNSQAEFAWHGYQYFKATNQQQEMLRMLALSLKYGSPDHSDYRTRRQSYLANLFNDILELDSYKTYRTSELLNQGLDVLYQDALLLARRGWHNISHNSDIGLGMQEIQDACKRAGNDLEPYLFWILAHFCVKSADTARAIQDVKRVIPESRNDPLMQFFDLLITNDNEKAGKVLQQIDDSFYVSDIVRAIKLLIAGKK